MFKTVLISLLFLCLLGLVFCMFMMRKNNNTCDNHKKINNAIYKYNVSQINNGIFNEDDVHQNQMESYDKTLWRLWDWGYENILPKEIYEKIKPYITKI